MTLSIPSLIREEHEELHRSLSKLVTLRGNVGVEAKKLEEVLRPHFEKEEELAMPLLGLLKYMAMGRPIEDRQRAAELAEKFAAEYEKMLQEHVEITRALESLEASAKKARKRAALTFAKNLRQHATLEEEILYPAALLIRNALKQ